MAKTIKTILQDCVAEAMGLPRDELPIDMRDLALAALNEWATVIWGSWPFDNEKLDEFTTPSPDADGIITFAATVDVVRAIKAVTTGNDDADVRIWNQDELLAAAQGVSVSSERFLHLKDDAAGCRRIKVAVDASVSAYKCLALARYVEATVEADYDEADPDATPTDYRVQTFLLDRAEPALRAYVKDALRKFEGIPQEKTGERLLALAVNREQLDSDRERRVEPRAPMFEDVGNWW